MQVCKRLPAQVDNAHFLTYVTELLGGEDLGASPGASELHNHCPYHAKVGSACSIHPTGYWDEVLPPVPCFIGVAGWYGCGLAPSVCTHRGGEDWSERGIVGDRVTKLTVIIWAWFGCDEDGGLWSGGLGYPPPVLIKDMMVQRDYSTLSGAHRGSGDVIVAEDSTQLLANES